MLKKLTKEHVKTIRNNLNKQDWDYISSYYELSEDFLREFKSYISWSCVSYYQKLSEKFIRDFSDKVCWYYISKHQVLSENFLREFKNKVEWEKIINWQILSEEFVKEMREEMSLKTLQPTVKTTVVNDIKPFEKTFKVTSLVIEGYDFEGFIKDKVNIAEYVDWYKISEKKIFEKLSDDFIFKFRHKLSWYKICLDNDLSYDFIKKYKEFISWELVADKVIKKDDGFGFLLEMKTHVKWEKLLAKFLIPEDLLYLLCLEFSESKKEEEIWKLISKEQTLSDNFIRDFYKQLDDNNCWGMVLDFQDIGDNIIRNFSKKSKKFRKALNDYKKSGRRRYKIDEDVVNDENCIFQAPEKKPLQEILNLVKEA